MTKIEINASNNSNSERENLLPQYLLLRKGKCITHKHIMLFTCKNVCLSNIKGQTLELPPTLSADLNTLQEQ